MMVDSRGESLASTLGSVPIPDQGDRLSRRVARESTQSQDTWIRRTIDYQTRANRLVIEGRMCCSPSHPSLLPRATTGGIIESL